MTAHDHDPLEGMILNTAYDAGGEIAYDDLRARIPSCGRTIWRALCRQHALGNIKRHQAGDPVRLTASARAAIAAGRAHRPLISVEAA